MQSSSCTDQNWHKHGDAANTATQKSRNNPKKPYNKVEKALNKMLAQPVEMSKGKSLLEKMGWRGGGLGKDGDGIVEPIAPKATYATRTVGLGLPTEINQTDTKRKRRNNNEWKGRQKKPKMTKIKKPKKPLKKKEEPNFVFTEEDIEFKKNFRENVLSRLLDFVKDDTQAQVVFQEQLTREERRDIHSMIEDIRLRKYRFCESENEFEMVENILAHSHYILLYKSNGIGIQRRVVIHKRAPDDIFLITPEDLRYNTNMCNGVVLKDYKDSEVGEIKCDEAADVEDDGAKSKEDDTGFDAAGIIDDETEEDFNSEDNEAESNKNKEINDSIKDKLMSRLIIFLKTFVDNTIFKELRFLGTFNEKEFVVIQLFFDVCSGNVVDEKYNILEALKHDLCNFIVGVDINETFVIYRTMKDPTEYDSQC